MNFKIEKCLYLPIDLSTCIFKLAIRFVSITFSLLIISPGNLLGGRNSFTLTICKNLC